MICRYICPMKYYTYESKPCRIDHLQTLTEGHVQINVHIITTVWVKPICMLARTQNESRPHRRQIRSPPPIQKKYGIPKIMIEYSILSNFLFRSNPKTYNHQRYIGSPSPKHKRGSSYPYNLLKSGIYYQPRWSGSHATMKHDLK